MWKSAQKCARLCVMRKSVPSQEECKSVPSVEECRSVRNARQCA